VVGLIGFSVDFGTFNLCILVFHASRVLAGTISFIAGVSSNFTWNRYWTYPDSRSKPILHQLVLFTIINAIGLGIRVPILHYLGPVLISLFTRLRLPFFTPDFLGNNGSLVVAVIIVLFWNFFANRYVTYNDVE
jgi:putative flippase GtrA